MSALFSPDDEIFMLEAYTLAKQAASLNEVPVGAVVVRDNVVIGKGYNQPIRLHDPSAHAEILALRDAAKYSQNYRLVDTTLYVTLEPCLMCVGALVHARIGRVVFAAADAKSGAVISQAKGLESPFLNHTVFSEGGLLSEQCSQLLSDFFKSRRGGIKSNRMDLKILSNKQ